MKHVQWSEVRGDDMGREMFLIVAEQTPEGWRFYERSTWEVRWYPVAASADRVEKAEGGSREE